MTGSQLLFPITFQLLRCLPFFERAVFYLPFRLMSRFLQTKIPMLFFLHRHIRLQNFCFVSLMEDGYSVVNDLSGETKSYVVLARWNYMHL